MSSCSFNPDLIYPTACHSPTKPFYNVRHALSISSICRLADVPNETLPCLAPNRQHRPSSQPKIAPLLSTPPPPNPNPNLHITLKPPSPPTQPHKTPSSSSSPHPPLHPPTSPTPHRRHPNSHHTHPDAQPPRRRLDPAPRRIRPIHVADPRIGGQLAGPGLQVEHVAVLSVRPGRAVAAEGGGVVRRVEVGGAGVRGR